MGNDDTHDIQNEPTFRIWNMIYSKHRNADSILQSMRMGRNYGVWSYNQEWDNKLVGLNMTGKSSFEVQLETEADSILFCWSRRHHFEKGSQRQIGRLYFSSEDTYVKDSCIQQKQ